MELGRLLISIVITMSGAGVHLWKLGSQNILIFYQLIYGCPANEACVRYHYLCLAIYLISEPVVSHHTKWYQVEEEMWVDRFYESLEIWILYECLKFHRIITLAVAAQGDKM